MTVEHGMCAASAGADFIGFVFAKSKRQVTPQQAKAIIDCLPKQVKTIGVFVNEPLEKINEIVAYCGLDMIQLHGNEKLSDYESAIYPIIKAVAVRRDTDLEGTTRASKVAYWLFDTWHKDMAGGSGMTFNWSMLKDKKLKKPYFLAGGLHVDNVQEAIQVTKPYAVDVSSGVESNGIKDKEKIIGFIKKVKAVTYEI